MAHVILEMGEYINLKNKEEKIEDIKEKILDLLDDKMNEAENNEEDTPKDFQKGYIRAIEMAKIIVEEFI